MITVPSFHPAWPLRRGFLLPERRPGLEVVHDEITGLKRGLAMSTGNPDEHDGLTRLKRPYPMQHLKPEQRPALSGLGSDLLQGLFGHAGIMLQEHPRHFPPVIEIPHVADKTHHRTNADIGGMQRIDLGTGIELSHLDPNRHCQPPVTVGKNATSSPSDTGSSSWHRS